MQVRDILKIKGKTPLYTVAPDTPLSECVITMADEDIGSLVVMDGKILAGMLTFREVIRVLARRQKELRQGPTPPVAELRVSHVMNPEPLVAQPDMDLDALRSLMVTHHQRYIPVVSHGLLQGVVSFHDVAKAVHEQQDFENRMLMSYIGDWPTAKHVAR